MHLTHSTQKIPNAHAFDILGQWALFLHATYLNPPSTKNTGQQTLYGSSKAQLNTQHAFAIIEQHHAL